MDCKTNEMVCQLAEITNAIDTPNVVDVLALVISALAAAGTLWIAWLNIRLLRRQTAFEQSVVTERYRTLRRKYATLLRNLAHKILIDRWSGNGFDSEHEASVFEQLEDIRDELGEMGQPLPRGWVMTASDDADIDFDLASVDTAMERIRIVLDMWVADPKSVEATLRSAAGRGAEVRD